MKYYLVMAMWLAIVVGVGCSNQLTYVSEGRPSSLEKLTLGSCSYWLYKPPDFVSGKKYPLILALHPAGVSAEEFVSFWQVNHCLVVIPECPGKMWGNAPEAEEQLIMTLMNELSRNDFVDQQKILFTGLSAGCRTVMAIGLKYPKRFTALAVFAGGSLFNFKGDLSQAKTLPIAFVLGADDPLLQYLRPVRDHLQADGFKLNYTEITGLGHTWPGEKERDRVINWFLEVAGDNQTFN